MEDIHATIQQGAQAFLRAEYTICVQFLLAFSLLLLLLTSLAVWCCSSTKCRQSSAGGALSRRTGFELDP